MKLVAFAASNSSTSINKQLVIYACSLLSGIDADILDLNDYELPLFSVDQEKLLGQPDKAQQFLDKISHADALIISFAEHNGAYTAAYKNLFDWCSRIEPKVYKDKSVVLLSTSPGKRGGASVLSLANDAIPRFGADVKASLSIPSFFDNFKDGRLVNSDLDQQLVNVVNTLI